MSFPKSKEPTLAIVASYTFNLLKDIRSNKRIHPQEWSYLVCAPLGYLKEMLAMVGFAYTPIKILGHFEGYRETSELVWQYDWARKAMEAMDLIPENAPLEQSRKIMLKALSLFMFVSRKMEKEKIYPIQKRYRDIFDQYLFFLYHLHGEICGYHRRRL